eukprot:5536469-Prymnesium_polylepis.1
MRSQRRACAARVVRAAPRHSGTHSRGSHSGLCGREHRRPERQRQRAGAGVSSGAAAAASATKAPCVVLVGARRASFHWGGLEWRVHGPSAAGRRLLSPSRLRLEGRGPGLLVHAAFVVRRRQAARPVRRRLRRLADARPGVPPVDARLGWGRLRQQGRPRLPQSGRSLDDGESGRRWRRGAAAQRVAEQPADLGEPDEGAGAAEESGRAAGAQPRRRRRRAARRGPH